MPVFEVIGKGIKTNKTRERKFRAIDEAAARKMALENETSVEEIIALPYPRASEALIARAEALGLGLSDSPDHFEVVYSIVVMLIHEKRTAKIQMETDINGDPWLGIIEPYLIQRSREGLRVKCWNESVNDQSFGFIGGQGPGWRRHLIDSIEDISDTGETFQPREKSQSPGVSISFDPATGKLTVKNTIG